MDTKKIKVEPYEESCASQEDRCGWNPSKDAVKCENEIDDWQINEIKAEPTQGDTPSNVSGKSKKISKKFRLGDDAGIKNEIKEDPDEVEIIWIKENIEPKKEEEGEYKAIKTEDKTGRKRMKTDETEKKAGRQRMKTDEKDSCKKMKKEETVDCKKLKKEEKVDGQKVKRKKKRKANREDNDNGNDAEDPLPSLGDLVGTEIPLPMAPPKRTLIKRGNGNHHFAAMGLETTGLDTDCNIMQITCSYLNNLKPNFCCYIKPEKGVHYQATNVNGFTFENGTLRLNNQNVETVSQEQGLTDFINYLQSGTILVSHNSNNFHSQLLMRSVSKSKVEKLLCEKVVGFCDSYQLLLELFPRWRKELPSHKLKDVIKFFSKEVPENFVSPSPGTENVVKIRNLARLIQHLKPTLGIDMLLLYAQTSTVDYIERLYEFNSEIQSNRESFCQLIQDEFITKITAKRMAESGLHLRHLYLAFMKANLNGLMELLNPRITKNRRVIAKLCRFFADGNTS